MVGRVSTFSRLCAVLAALGFVASLTTITRAVGTEPTVYKLSAVLASASFCSFHLWMACTRPSRLKMRSQAAFLILVAVLGLFLTRDDRALGNAALLGISLVLGIRHGLFSHVRVSVVTGGAIGICYATYRIVARGSPWQLPMATMVAGTGVFAILFYLFYEEIRAMQRENAEEQMRVSVARGKSSELIEQISRAEGRLRNAEQAWHNERQKFQRLKAELEQLRARMEPADLDHFGLSPREKDVLKLLVETKASNKQIGVLLDITERTVKSHIYSICNKTGVDRRVELIELFRWNSWAETDSRREQC